MTFVILVHPPVHGPVQEVQTSQQDHWTHHQTLQGSTIALEKSYWFAKKLFNQQILQGLKS